MLYCFDSRLPWDYTKKEMAISKMNNNGILYDNELKKFMDFDGNIVDIKNKLIFPRTGINHIYNMNNEIVIQGGIPVVSNEQVKVVENWPNYYVDKRESRIVKGYDLVNQSIIKEIELCYGKEIFIKTKFKNFSGVISIDLLKDTNCAFYKTLLHHLEDDFIISKKEVKLMKYSLANIIRNERLNLNMSPSELSRKTGIDRTTISRIESGERKKPIIDTLIRLSKGLNMDLSLLLAVAGYTSHDITIKDNKENIKSFTQFIITIKGGFITDAIDEEQAFKNAIKSIIKIFDSVEGVSDEFDKLLKNSSIYLDLKFKDKM